MQRCRGIAWPTPAPVTHEPTAQDSRPSPSVPLFADPGRAFNLARPGGDTAFSKQSKGYLGLTNDSQGLLQIWVWLGIQMKQDWS